MSAIRYFLQGIVVTVLVLANTILSTVMVFLLAIVKLIAPKGVARNTVTHWLSSVGEYWISFNQLMTWFLHSIKWDIQLPDGIKRDGRYLVYSNHQSWVDIVVIQHCLNRRAPFSRFLLKQELIWVPFLGFCWWALDMAFLRRYSRKELIKNPALRGKDLENAARTCEKLKHIPVSMMTFPEGTRFSEAKQEQQKSPFRHLLRPRYGGIGQILYSFDEAFDCLIDITIVYPDGAPNIWQFVSGQIRNIQVRIQLLPIEENVRGKNFRDDPEAKAALVGWLNDLWVEKDQYISSALVANPGSMHGEDGKDSND